MSSELAAWVALALICLGHGCLMIWTLNVGHGLGYDRPGYAWRLRLALAILAAVGVGLLIAMVQGWPAWSRPLRAHAAICMAVSGLVVPGLTIARRLRSVPRGIRVETRTIDLAAQHGRDALIGEGWRSRMLRLPGNDSLLLDLRSAEVTIPTLPKSLDGLTITQLTDLHLARTYGRRFFDAVIDQAAGWDADLVLFTGDLADDDDAIAWVGPVLGRLRGEHGQFAILGNHDQRHRPELLRRELDDAGFVDLEGRWLNLEIAGHTLTLGGTAYPWGPLPAGVWPYRADVRILMSHSPDLFPWAARRGVDLVLSGHNHGGQVRLPVIGPVLMPSRYGRRFDRGFFEQGSSRLYVSQGIAALDPIRYGGARPEVTRLVLRSQPVAPITLPHQHREIRGRRDESAHP